MVTELTNTYGMKSKALIEGFSFRPYCFDNSATVVRYGAFLAEPCMLRGKFVKRVKNVPPRLITGVNVDYLPLDMYPRLFCDLISTPPYLE